MYHIIVNPGAKSGLGEKTWLRVHHTLALRRLPFRSYSTRYHGHARELAAQITSGPWNPEEDSLIAIGGDGTANEVINGICHLDQVPFGYIGTGSANDFSRGLELPAEPEAALESILRKEALRPIDMGTAVCGNRKRRFAISLGIGYDAAICHEALYTPLKALLNRLHLGKLTYAFLAIRQLFALKPFQLDMTLDNGRSLHYDNVYFCVAMNQKYEGGGIQFAPNADCQDGQLDIMVVEGFSKLKVLWLIPLAFQGRHTRFRGIHMMRSSSLQLHASRPLPVHLDGESGGLQTDLEIALEQEPLQVISPGQEV